MCRSIKVLRVQEAPATPDEITAAALQFVRKVSGYRQPSKSNEAAFNSAVEEIAHATTRLLESLPRGARTPARREETHVDARSLTVP